MRARPVAFQGREFVPVQVPVSLRALPDFGGGVRELRHAGGLARVTSLERTLVDGIGHLLLHKRTTFICGGNVDSEVESFEKEANDFAARMVGTRRPARLGDLR